MAEFKMNLDFERDFSIGPTYRVPEDYPEGTETTPFVAETQPINTESFADGELRSAFGTPILGSVKIDNLILPTGMFQITGSNNIIETDIAYLDGTVNEYFGQNDYEIGLRGYLIGDDYQDALNKANELDRICKMKASHAIRNALMNQMGIDNFVIRQWKITPEEGGEHYYLYRIDGKSERPIELDIKEL